jgi:HEAT repeat protein
LAKDPAWEVRNVVMQSLGRLHSAHHVGLLEEAMRDNSWWVRFSAAQALWELGAPGRKALTETMTGGADKFAREISRQILEEHGSAAARGARA